MQHAVCDVRTTLEGGMGYVSDDSGGTLNASTNFMSQLSCLHVIFVESDASKKQGRRSRESFLGGAESGVQKELTSASCKLICHNCRDKRSSR
jgi:hypothetical protein